MNWQAAGQSSINKIISLNNSILQNLLWSFSKFCRSAWLWIVWGSEKHLKPFSYLELCWQDEQVDLSARRIIPLPKRHKEKQSYEIQELKAKSQAEVRAAGSARILFV